MRVAVIGCGFYAQNHLNAWHDLRSEGAELVAVCDRDPDKAEQAGNRFGAAIHTDAKSMLAQERLDLVDIVTDVGSHRSIVELAAAASVATIVQKPLGPNWDDCVAIAEAVSKSGIPFGVHENFRFQSPILRVKKLIENDAIGRPSYGRISFRTGYDVFRAQPYLRRDPRLVILDVGIHLLDVARSLMGEVEAISCTTQSRAPDIAGEDTATMMLRHTNGAVSVVDCSFVAQRLVDAFPQTLVDIEGPAGNVATSSDCIVNVLSRGLRWTEDVRTPLLSWTEHPWHVTQQSVLAFNRHAMNAISSGQAPETHLDDNLRTFALVEAAYEASSTRQWVHPRQWSRTT